MTIIIITAVLGAIVVFVSLARLMKALKAVETEAVRAAQEVARLRQRVEDSNRSPGTDGPSPPVAP